MYTRFPLLVRKSPKDECDIILNIFYKCATTENTTVKQECNQLTNHLNATFMELYLNCVQRQNDKK